MHSVCGCAAMPKISQEHRRSLIVFPFNISQLRSFFLDLLGQYEKQIDPDESGNEHHENLSKIGT